MKLTFTLAVHVHYHLMLLDNIRIKKMKQQQPPHHTTKQREKKPGRGAIRMEFGGMEKR